MKLQSNVLLGNLSTADLRHLTKEVAETIAVNIKNAKRKTFTAAQYWDMQRRKRNLFSNRSYF